MTRSFVWSNGYWTRLADCCYWVWFNLGVPFFRPCANLSLVNNCSLTNQYMWIKSIIYRLYKYLSMLTFSIGISEINGCQSSFLFLLFNAMIHLSVSDCFYLFTYLKYNLSSPRLKRKWITLQYQELQEWRYRWWTAEPLPTDILLNWWSGLLSSNISSRLKSYTQGSNCC